MSVKTPEWLQSLGSLLTGYGIIGGFLVGGNSLFGPFGTWTIVFTGVVLTIGWTIFWFYFRVTPPKNKTQKFGIALLIATESEDVRQRLENDLSYKLTEILASQNLHETFIVVTATNEQAKHFSPILTEQRNLLGEYKSRNPPEQVPPERSRVFNRFQKRTNCHFFIWGTLTKRRDAELKGENAYVFRTDAIVVHSALLPHQQKVLSDQFRIWFREIKIDEKIEYQGLQFTANEVLSMAHLIIGSAATMVGNVLAGISLHETLLRSLASAPADPYHTAIRKHVKKMLAEAYHYLAKISFLGDDDGDLAKRHIEKSLQYEPSHYSSHILLARIQFEHDRDAEAALGTTNKSRPYSGGSGVHRYNVGFLEMFAGKYRDSLRTYADIFKNGYDGEDETVEQVIEFNEKWFRQENFVPSALIIGMLLFKKLGNLPEALRYFEEFLAKADSTRMQILIAKAGACRDEVLVAMSLQTQGPSSARV